MDLVLTLIALITGIILGYVLNQLLMKTKMVSRDLLDEQIKIQLRTTADLQYARENCNALQRQYNEAETSIEEKERRLVALQISNSNHALQLQNHAEKIDALTLQLADAQNILNTLEQENKSHQQAISTYSVQLKNAHEQTRELTQQCGRKEQTIEELGRQINKFLVENNKLTIYNNSLEEKLNLQKEEITAIHNKAQLQFEKIASLILEEKAARFTETNKQNIENILLPLKTDINNFKTRIEETYDKESKQRFALEEKVKDLIEQTNKISNEANNLAAALKGQTKTQGNWGEMILERILETSGLVKDREYFTQPTITNEEGKNFRPDVFVHLPDNRVIIIDAKVSLSAYERYHNETDTTQKKNDLDNLLRSIYNHINELSGKKYDDLDNALDFTMMFVPVEPAYMLAIQHDNNLWNYAYGKRILLVSPTNLIACLKIISDVWKREKQSKNAREIVKRGELLYEKVVAFVSSMEDLGRQVNKTQHIYHTAIDQLKNSKGNIIYQALRLQSLGLKSGKTMPEAMLPDDARLRDDD